MSILFSLTEDSLRYSLNVFIANQCDSMEHLHDHWAHLARTIIRAEMVARDISYQKLATLLDAAGNKTNAKNLSNKINRGAFSASFFLQILHLIGADEILIKRYLDGLSKNDATATHSRSIQ